MKSPRELAIESLNRVKARDRDGWLALYEDDGFIEDPVGPSFMCPDGKGHQGKAGITKFYDTYIAGVSMDYKIHKSFECGDEVAIYIVMYVKQANGETASVEAVNLYKRSKNGKLFSLRSFWEMPAGAGAH